MYDRRIRPGFGGFDTDPILVLDFPVLSGVHLNSGKLEKPHAPRTTTRKKRPYFDFLLGKLQFLWGSIRDCMESNYYQDSCKIHSEITAEYLECKRTYAHYIAKSHRTPTCYVNGKAHSAAIKSCGKISWTDLQNENCSPGQDLSKGPPAVIRTDIEIRSFGPISETEMIYSMDCYFRQTWVDPRLKFKSESLKVLSMDWNFLKRVWIPDTFFLNGKSSYLHKVTVPNKFIRVREDGELRYSMRLTIKASCPMHLRKYPLDTQACPLEIASFAYPSHEVTYQWKSAEAVQISKDVTLSQYDILNVTLSNFTSRGAEGGKRTTLRVIFLIRRNRGYFILQIYAPCAMIVGASWVSFWINRSDAAGRVAVGATTVLTLVTMGFGGRGSHQRVAYATALDWFVIMCFSFVFSALVEYAFVNFIDHYEKRQLKKNLEREREQQKKKKEVTQEDHAESSVKEPAAGRSPTGSDLVRLHIDESDDKDNHVAQKQQQLQQLVQSRPPRIGLRLRRRPFTAGRCSLDKGGYKSRQIASKVDTYARIAFPVTFAVLNILYWTLFLHTIDDETTIEEPTIDETGGGAFVT